MVVYWVDIYLENSWHQAGQIFVNNNKIVFAYDKSYIVTCYQKKLHTQSIWHTAVHTNIPLRLMEIFDEMHISAWLKSVGDAEHRLPSCDNQFGNIRWRSTESTTFTQAPCEYVAIPLEDLVTASYENVLPPQFSRFEHRHTHSPYLLCATDGEMAFPTSYAFEAANLYPVVIPRIGGNKPRKLLSGVVRLNYLISQLLQTQPACSHDTFPQSDIYLPRFDVDYTEHASLIAADPLTSLDISLPEDVDFAKTAMLVGTHISVIFDNPSAKRFMVDLIVQRLIYDALRLPFSTERLFLLRRHDHVCLAPPIIGGSYGASVNTLSDLVSIDYAFLSNELADWIDPTELLYKLNDVAEKLAEFPVTLRTQLGSDAEHVIQCFNLHNVNQRLLRRGLLL